MSLDMFEPEVPGDDAFAMHATETAPAPKPKIAIMGEFSVGKSTLSNLLLGTPALPIKVTATQLPPVWMSHGDRAPFRVDLDGAAHPVELGDLSQVTPQNTAHLRVFHRTEALELCDLIDMPGISDPNMSPEVWQRLLAQAQGVVWCTHATQAWRQSEAAVWADFSDALADKSLLLVTRIDKLTTLRDRARVLARVEAETAGLFRGVFPISLTQALAAGEDEAAWQACGAEDFAAELIALAQALAGAEADAPDVADQEASGVPKAPRAPVAAVATPGGVIPRRVAARLGAPRVARPPADEAGTPLQP